VSDDGRLRAKVRQAMDAGTLPSCPPARWWGGAATGTHCAVCEAPTTNGEIELKLEFPHENGNGSTLYHVHSQCFRIFIIELGAPSKKQLSN
jgi:hypothetical protein